MKLYKEIKMEIRVGTKYKRFYHKQDGNPFDDKIFKDEVLVVDKKFGNWKDSSGIIYEEDFIQYTINNYGTKFSTPLSVFIGSYIIEEVL